jgi:GDP-L-galactose phosphorylase
VLPGDHNFVATLIEGRDQKKRTTEFGINQVLQPFDSAKFNFTKVSPDEVIFRFHESEKDSSECFDDAPHAVSASPSAILINVSISPPTDDSISFCLADTITKSLFALHSVCCR